MLLETKDLTKIYRRGEKEFRAVDKASISVEKGELAVITGPSGCGKSTLFHLISGITVPDSGLVLFEGDEITGISPQAAARLRAEKISYILQGNSLLANLTVLENICLPHRLSGCGIDVEERAIRLLEEFGLEGMAEEYPGNLSGGERRRAAIVPLSMSRFWWLPMSPPVIWMRKTRRSSWIILRESGKRGRLS